MVDVYTFSNSESHIIPFLWTMSAEMLGSIFVFALLPIWRHVSRKTLLAPVLGVILLSSPNTAFLAAFTAGVAFAAARTSGFTEHVSQLRYAQTGSLIGMFLVLVAVGSGRTFDARFNAAAAMVITGMIFVNRGARAFFSCRPSRWLGSISFPLYLTHASVLCSLTSYLIVVYRNHLSLSVSLGIGLASVGTTILVAAAFMPIERLTKHVGHVLSAAFVPVKPEDGTAI
jgi:peptidoglycan/LPS O-acetylase OafA/YrhL